VEDHTIINSLSNNLPHPYENVLARSLMKGNELFIHRHTHGLLDVWIVFYRPVKIRKKLPRKLDEKQIVKMGKEMARFHKACHTVRGTLPSSSKTMMVDIDDLLSHAQTPEGNYEYHAHLDLIHDHCERFKKNYRDLGAEELPVIPVFVDWNIGNFSVTPGFKLFSRWDYDWFRMSSRIVDFYFFSRIVSEAGDRTMFTYNMDVLMQDRFLLFLRAYHSVFPLSEQEILLLKEAYRFFLLNYVVKYGRYFFHELFATKLQNEVLEHHLPSIDEQFDPEPLLHILKD
jgi:hypothetical protein